MGTATPKLLNRVFEETMTLLIDARDYVARHEPVEAAQLALTARLLVSRETMRITSRLTQIMAWLLVQKAVFAGEMSRAEAAGPAHRLAGHKLCLDAESGRFDGVPPRLSTLLERSYNLYVRIARLDALAEAQPA